MRKFALVLALLPMASCSTFFGGPGARETVTAEQRARGIKPVSVLTSAYNQDRYLGAVGRRSAGISNAFGRDLASITSFMDRHIWNYNQNDPYINAPSQATRLQHVGAFGVDFVTAMPLVDEVTSR